MSLESLYWKFLRFPKVLRKKDFYSRKGIRMPYQIAGNKNAAWAFANNTLHANSVVYSFGIGTDISFDLHLIQNFNLIVYGFDPTPKSINWLKTQDVPDKFKATEVGLAKLDGIVTFNPPINPNHVSGTILERPETSGLSFSVPVKRLSTLMKEFGHTNIDLLKMDIEGAEYDVIEDIINSKVNITQILIEFHHRFPNVGVNKTKQAIQLLQKSGYKIFYVSPNGEEFSFIK